MRTVVLQHLLRQVAERERPDALLPPRSGALRGGQLPQGRKVASSRLRERGEPLGNLAAPVVAFGGDAGPVEVRKLGAILGQQAPDSLAVPVLLEIGEVPDVLDEGKGIAGGPRPRPLA